MLYNSWQTCREFLWQFLLRLFSSCFLSGWCWCSFCRFSSRFFRSGDFLLLLLLLPPLLPPLAPHLYQGMCVVLLGQAYQPRASEVFEISSTPSGAASKPSTLPASGSLGSSVFGTVGDDRRTAAGMHRRDARPTVIYHTFLFCHLHLFLTTGRHCALVF